MHDDFLKLAVSFRNEHLFKADALFVANKHIWSATFAEHFQGLCSDIQKMQKISDLPAISYLEYTMLYTNFVNRQYVSEVLVYNDKYCLDKNQRIVGRYDISALFAQFDELWDRLLAARKKFIGRVTSQDIKAFMIESIPYFYYYFTILARIVIRDYIDKEPLVSISKGDIFMINVGEYMAKTKTIFTENRSKDAERLLDWFLKQSNRDYVYGDYSNLDFSNKSFAGINFCYAQFHNSTMNNTNLDGSRLIGTNFRNAHLEGCSFKYTSINEADFSNANLRNTSFVKAKAKYGVANGKRWTYARFEPTNFRNADLTGADFTGADLTGANFSGAVLTNAIFTDAVLTNAVIDNYAHILS